MAPMRSHPHVATYRYGVASLVLASLCVVHCHSLPTEAAAGEKAAAAQSPQSAKPPAPKERAFRGALPANVEDMREQILAAVHAGDLAELTGAIEWNEIKPDFGKDATSDPFAHWKAKSADGQGRDVLAVLGNILSLPPARLAIGRDPENTLVYVWPYLAELPLDTLTPAEEVELYRLMPVADARAMIKAKKWTWWRIAIGADGTWHTFRTYP
jgi:hypothetical protein